MPRSVWKGPWLHAGVIEEVKAILASRVSHSESCLTDCSLFILAKNSNGVFQQTNPIRTKARYYFVVSFCHLDNNFDIRSCAILPQFIGIQFEVLFNPFLELFSRNKSVSLQVHNGKKYLPVTITQSMVHDFLLHIFHVFTLHVWYIFTSRLEWNWENFLKHGFVPLTLALPVPRRLNFVCFTTTFSLSVSLYFFVTSKCVLIVISDNIVDHHTYFTWGILFPHFSWNTYSSCTTNFMLYLD